MRLFAVLVLLAFGVPVFAQSLERDTIRLRFVKPSRVAQALSAPAPSLLPAGIAAIVPDDQNNTLIVRGTLHALIQVRKAVRRLDLPPRQLQIKLRLVRVRFTQSGAGEEETLGTPIVTTVDNKRVLARLDGPGGSLKVEIVPRVSSGDESVTLDATLSTRPESGRRRFTREARQTVRVPVGEMRRITGVTDSSSVSVQARVGQGTTPGNADLLAAAAPFTAVYLEATPSLINDDFYQSTPKP